MSEFPSVEWFEAVRQCANGDPQFASLGSCNCRMGVKVGDAAFVIIFEGFECTGVSAIDEDALRSVDFYLDMPPIDWQDFIRNIASNGGSDPEHTLNTLDIVMPSGCVRSYDELRRNAFFRYHLSVQAFFDASAQLETEFASAG